MSQFATIKTKIKDKNILISCLEGMGYPVEVGKNLSLYGYQGDLRSETANIVIRRKHVGPQSNDIGFKKVGNHYDLIISQYDKGIRDGGKIIAVEGKVKDIAKEKERQAAVLERKRKRAEKQAREMEQQAMEIERQRKFAEEKAREMERQAAELGRQIKRKYAEDKIRKTMEGMKGKGFKLRKRTERGKQIVFEYVRLT